MNRFDHRAACLGLLLGLAFVSPGCGRGNFAKYVPSEATAAKALETALTAWTAGDVPARIESFSPPIQFVDTERRPGQKLQSYELLGEVPSEDGVRCFAVKLRLQQPAEELKARYFVVGKDPLWIFRQEDYERVAHWEHPMHDAKGAVKKR